MELGLVIVGALLLAVQAHRNWLMIRAAAQTKQSIQIEVQPAEICYDSLAKAMESSWPNVTVSNDLELDYDKLAAAFAKINVTVPVTVVGGSQPTYVPPTPYPSGPYWISEVNGNEFNTTPNDHIYTINVSGEEREIPVRSFPKRTVNDRGDST